jgi:methylenetetrahydrofolate dehydrogenase (NADP+) / methenyltetrahydrofolate cyclohydrolase
MTASIIDGAKIAAEIREQIANEVAALTTKGIVPGLAAVLVGDDPASATYVESIKGKAARAVGMTPFIKKMPASTSQQEVIAAVEELNADPKVHGIIVQLPLPEAIDPMAVQSAIDPMKDVDGLHPTNAGLLTLGRPRFIPCTPLGVKVMLEKVAIKVEGAHVVVVGRSNLVGRPLSILLSHKSPGANATVTLCHTATTDLPTHTTQADILIVAAGAPRSIGPEMVKPGATVIDVGINRTPEGLVGDVDFEPVKEIAAAITPVPGGVGKLTVAMLLSNTLIAAKLSIQ